MKYQSYNYNEKMEFTKSYHFPSLTFCPVMESKYPPGIMELGNVSDQAGRQYWHLIKTVDEPDRLRTYNINDVDINSPTFRQIFNAPTTIFANLNDKQRQMVKSLFKSLFIDCYYGGDKCDNDDFHDTPHPLYVNCKTFIPKNPMMLGAHLGFHSIVMIPYDSKVSEKVSPYQESKPMNNIHGLKLSIHPQNSDPDITNNGIRLMIGNAPSIIVSQTDFKRLGTPYSECQFYSHGPIR